MLISCRSVLTSPLVGARRSEIINCFIFRIPMHNFPPTFKQWTTLSNRSNNSTSSKLTDRELHEQQRNSADEERYEVWQQKDACEGNANSISLNLSAVGQGNV